jgi:hypothetical protein
VQDRVIRLEENLRYRQILSPAALQQSNGLRMPQIVALRFAADDELEALMAQTLAGSFKSRDIKQAVRNWRADTFRV